MANKENWGTALFVIDLEDGNTRSVLVSGRDRWALESLIAAGEGGCTPLDTPGPRWSGYVHNLRGLSVPIETITERHDGRFAGPPCPLRPEGRCEARRGGQPMKGRKPRAPTPRDLFERKIHNQFGVDGAILRALGELQYPGKS